LDGGVIMTIIWLNRATRLHGKQMQAKRKWYPGTEKSVGCLVTGDGKNVFGKYARG
jgi:hypothetical protein